MALQTIVPSVPIGPPYFISSGPQQITLDANGEYTSWIIRAPRTGTIDRIHFRAAAVTADGDGLRCRIETVNASDGMPSGTLLGGSSEVTHTTTTPNAWNRGTAGLGAAVTRGDLIAIKLLSPAGTTFNGIIWVCNTGVSGQGLSGGFPYRVDAVPTASKLSFGISHFALEYDDGVTPYIEQVFPGVMTNNTYNSGSTPDEQGMVFQLPFPVRVVGLWSGATGGASAATNDLILYDAANTVLASVSMDPDQERVPGSQTAHFVPIAPVTLAKDTNYRLTCKPTSGTGVNFISIAADTSAGGTRLRDAMPLATWQKTSRVDAGSWTDVQDVFFAMGLMVDQFDDGVGGAAGLLGNPLRSPLVN